MLDYEDNICVICILRGSVLPYAITCAIPATLLTLFLNLLSDWVPEAQDYTSLEIVTSNSVIWNATTAVLVVLLAFRCKQALGRFWEGTSLLHQMRGEWFDVVSCLMAFSREAKIEHNRKKEVWEFRNTLVRLMSLMHGSALDEISGLEASSSDVIDIQGLDTRTLQYLQHCQQVRQFSKVEALQHLIQVLITHNHKTGILATPSPILSRTFQTLSRGYVNLLNARKIKDTMFPMPFVQTLRVLLIIHSVLTPGIMTGITDSKFWSMAFTFLSVSCMYCINRISWELEMPFGSDANDLPLQHFQEEMNSTLIMLIDERSDLVPGSSQIATNLGLGTEIKTKFQRASTSKSLADADFFLKRQESIDVDVQKKVEEKAVDRSCDHWSPNGPQQTPLISELGPCLSVNSMEMVPSAPQTETMTHSALDVELGSEAPDAIRPSWDSCRGCLEAAKLSIGDLVERRDIGKEWRKGYVTSLDPLLVTDHPDKKANGVKWDEVRPYKVELSDALRQEFSSLVQTLGGFAQCHSIALQSAEQQALALQKCIEVATAHMELLHRCTAAGQGTGAPDKNVKLRTPRFASRPHSSPAGVREIWEEAPLFSPEFGKDGPAMTPRMRGASSQSAAATF